MGGQAKARGWATTAIVAMNRPGQAPPPGLAAGGGAIMRGCTYTRQTGHGPAVPLMPAHGRWPQVLTRPHKGWQGAPKVFLD